MAIRRALVLLKRSALDVYTNVYRDPQIMSLIQTSHQVIGNLANRHNTHIETVKFCEDVLRRKPLEWKTVVGDELEAPISDVDLVITIGGDGTLLRASHYVDSSAPIFGVNSDPTRITEIKENLESFDASRSTGYMCAATAESFEQVLDEILEGRRKPVQLSRLSTCIDGVHSHAHALNDVLLAHSCPAAVTHCSFRIIREDSYDSDFPLVHSRSSGLRVCTAAGSTAAMRSAGGCPMPILSRDLQYMVREPILLHDHSKVMHGWIRTNEVMHIVWGCTEGFIYIDGSHVYLPLKYGCTVQISSKSPPLQVYLHSSCLQHDTD
ncbi:hypothetical protein KI387_002488 [Taxus chinensis]|uniref:NADH kinase n=1 Tax=Taxus chinensis TaxID=29808 RepID=A0AA38LPY1_TAXCH|nr:hypothetical protein KI387_002488 [Taxus chinensis]